VSSDRLTSAAPRRAAAAPRRARGGGVVRSALSRVLTAEQFASLRSMYKIVTRKELKAAMPLDLKLRAWRRGFRASSVALYGIENVESGLYVSDYERVWRGPDINPIPALFVHKLLLRQILADRGFAQPETLALVVKGGIIADPLGAGHYVDAAELERRLVAAGGRYIWKLEDGSKGSGIELLEVRDGALVGLRGEATRPFRIPSTVRRGHLIERVVEQHPFWAAFSPHSVNTIRILTLWTPGDAEPFVARAVQRMGTRATLPTDNWSGGGICAPVELETGRLGAGRVNPFKSGREDRRYAQHPETGTQIEGAVLPGWREIREATLAAARALPYAPYIGWDMAVDPDGRPVVIEGNKNTDVDLLQVHGGLLTEPAIRRFYETSGVI
jgi:plasmid stabilization system protein ParE